MSSQQEGLRTPHRTTMNNMFDDSNTPNSNPFTPCTRLSRMTIESQSNGLNGRLKKTTPFQYPVSNFNDKLMQVVREEEQQQQQQGSHPNLDMFLGTDRISMNKDQFFNSSFSEDEESDEGDLFSSSLCPMSSPERILTRQSIFDDEPMNSPPAPTLSLNKKSIFDDDDDEDDEEEDNEHHKMQQDEDYYDPSTLWLSQIYHDTSDSPSSSNTTSSQESSSDDNENRAPRHWHRSKEEKKTRRTLPHEEDNTANERLPLREIKFEDYLSDNEEVPAKKKSLLSNGKQHKMRFMRTLSPPRFAKRKQVLLS